MASTTNRFPGPAILSTLGMVSVPRVMAAMAWAPPTAKTRSTPAMLAAARVTVAGNPLGPGGVHMMISPAPATTAGMAVINIDDGYAAVPPGAYIPDTLDGRDLLSNAESIVKPGIRLRALVKRPYTLGRRFEIVKKFWLRRAVSVAKLVGLDLQGHWRHAVEGLGEPCDFAVTSVGDLLEHPVYEVLGRQVDPIRPSQKIVRVGAEARASKRCPAEQRFSDSRSPAKYAGGRHEESPSVWSRFV